MIIEPLKSVQQIVSTDPRYHNVAARFELLDHKHTDNRPMLLPLLSLAQPRSICEVGSWMGFTSRYFAAFPFVEEVVCVDHWDRTRVENWTPGAHPEDWMDFMYEHFLANCIHTGTAQKIHPLRLDSIEGAKYLSALGKRFDMIYIDGAHATVMVRIDLRNYYPLLKAGGLFTGDDWSMNWEPENVQLAVTEFINENQLPGYAAGNLWWIAPVK